MFYAEISYTTGHKEVVQVHDDGTVMSQFSEYQTLVGESFSDVLTRPDVTVRRLEVGGIITP